MINKLLLVLMLLMAVPAIAADSVRVVYIGLENDPYYEPQRTYTGLSLKDKNRPIDGARLSLKDAKILSRALGVKFELDEQFLSPNISVASAVREAREAGATAIILDMPETEMADVLKSEGTEGVIFNVRDSANYWRGTGCAPALVNTLPSVSMLTDALAQHLRFRNWQRILLLRGSAPADMARSDAVQASARKFGLKIVAKIEFELSNDPRQRSQNNIALLTGTARHDVIWMVDTEGEFGRYVPYATKEPSPVIGSEGLDAVAWHWTWERYGAPQLNQRFRRLADREMTSTDWAAWAAFRIVVAAVEKTRTSDRGTIQAAIRSGEMAIDLYKGPPGSIRVWDGQLRQPILLATHNAVIATAPRDGFEHRENTLDTLGYDRSESECHR